MLVESKLRLKKQYFCRCYCATNSGRTFFASTSAPLSTRRRQSEAGLPHAAAKWRAVRPVLSAAQMFAPWAKRALQQSWKQLVVWNGRPTRSGLEHDAHISGVIIAPPCESLTSGVRLQLYSSVGCKERCIRHTASISIRTRLECENVSDSGLFKFVELDSIQLKYYGHGARARLRCRRKRHAEAKFCTS